MTGVGGALASVPVKFRDREICLTAVKNDVPLGRAWKSVPECLRDGEMCLEAIRQNSSAIEIVPKEQRVPEMCLKFLAVNGLALESIPKNRAPRRTAPRLSNPMPTRSITSPKNSGRGNCACLP